MPPRVRITGWRPGLNKVEMTKAVRRHTGLGLKDAKAITDRVLTGEFVELPTGSDRDARGLAHDLDAAGAEVQIVGGCGIRPLLRWARRRMLPAPLGGAGNMRLATSRLTREQLSPLVPSEIRRIYIVEGIAVHSDEDVELVRRAVDRGDFSEMTDPSFDPVRDDFAAVHLVETVDGRRFFIAWLSAAELYAPDHLIAIRETECPPGEFEQVFPILRD